MLEKDLRPTVKDFLHDKGYTTFDEPYLLSRRIDIVGINKNCRNIIAVELKLFRWQYALAQAYLNTRVASYSYVALPEEKLNAVQSTEFKELGIGLLAVNGYVREVIRASRSKRIQHLLRKKFFDTLSHGE